METKPEGITEIRKGLVEGSNNIFEFVLGFCDDPPYPYITIDYHLPATTQKFQRFGGRSPLALMCLLKDQGYPIPHPLSVWESQARLVTMSMLSDAEDMTLEGLHRHYTEVLSVNDIKAFIHEEVSPEFQAATITLALHTYWGIQSAKAWNEGLDQMLQEGSGVNINAC